MRYPVEMILDLLNSGMTFDEILADYPDLEKEDLQACLLFSAWDKLPHEIIEINF